MIQQESLIEILDRMEQRANAATPGPWEFQTGCSWRRFGAKADGDVICPTNHRIDHHVDLIVSTHDGKFIAAARTDLPVLLNVLRRAEEVISEYCPADIAFGWEKESVRLLREPTEGKS